MGKEYILEMWTEPLGDVIPKLFVICLFIVVCLALVRNIRLILQLWSFSRKRESLGGNISDNYELIVESALKGKIDKASKQFGSADAINKPALLFNMDCIETRFLYLWETYELKKNGPGH
jgi:hypothetical protein